MEQKDLSKQKFTGHAPPPKIVAEKEEVEIPEHMKDMFERKTTSQADEELDEEIGKS